MIINKEENSVEFENVFRAKTSINDKKQTIRVDHLSFSTDNSKGDFASINNIEDLLALHDKGKASAVNLLKAIKH